VGGVRGESPSKKEVMAWLRKSRGGSGAVKRWGKKAKRKRDARSQGREIKGVEKGSSYRLNLAGHRGNSARWASRGVLTGRGGLKEMGR